MLLIGATVTLRRSGVLSRVSTLWVAVALVVAVGLGIVLAMTTILSVDLSPRLVLQVGDLAPTDIKAPKAISFPNPVLTSQAQQAARDAVQPQYDFTSERAIAIREWRVATLAKELVSRTLQEFTRTRQPVVCIR